MANVLVEEQYLKDIANAIRTKNKTQDDYTPGQMDDAILEIETDKPDQQVTVDPSTEQQTITPDEGYELSEVTVNAVTSDIDNNITADNIKDGVTILGVQGTLQEGQVKGLLGVGYNYTIENPSLSYSTLFNTKDVDTYYGVDFTAHIDGKSLIFDYTVSGGQIKTCSLETIIPGTIIDFTVGYKESDYYYVYVCSDGKVYVLKCNPLEQKVFLYDTYIIPITLAGEIYDYFVIGNPYGNAFIVSIAFDYNESTNKINVNTFVCYYYNDTISDYKLYNSLNVTFTTLNTREKFKNTTFGQNKFVGTNIMMYTGGDMFEIRGFVAHRKGIINSFRIPYNMYSPYGFPIACSLDAGYLYCWKQSSSGYSSYSRVMKAAYTFTTTQGGEGTLNFTSVKEYNLTREGQGFPTLRFIPIDYTRCLIFNYRWWSKIYLLDFTQVQTIADINCSDDLSTYDFTRMDYRNIVFNGTKVNIIDISGTKVQTEAIVNSVNYYNTQGLTQATSDEVLSGKYAATNKLIQGTMPNNGTLTYNISTSQQTIPAGYTSGGTIQPLNSTTVPDFLPQNVLRNKSLLDLQGVAIGRQISVGLNITKESPTDVITTTMTDALGNVMTPVNGIYNITTCPTKVDVFNNGQNVYSQNVDIIDDGVLNINVPDNTNWLKDDFNNEQLEMLYSGIIATTSTSSTVPTFVEQDNANVLYTNNSWVSYSFSGLSTFTIELEFYKTDNSSISRVLGLIGTYSEIELRSTNQVNWSGTTYSNIPWTNNSWNSLKIIKDNTNICSLYINNKLVTTRNWSSLNLTGIYIGAGLNIGYYQFNGYYRNVKISTLKTDAQPATVSLQSVLLPENIKKSITIAGITGTYEGAITEEEYNSCVSLTNDILGNE